MFHVTGTSVLVWGLYQWTRSLHENYVGLLLEQVQQSRYAFSGPVLIALYKAGQVSVLLPKHVLSMTYHFCAFVSSFDRRCLRDLKEFGIRYIIAIQRIWFLGSSALTHFHSLVGHLGLTAPM